MKRLALLLCFIVFYFFKVFSQQTTLNKLAVLKTKTGDQFIGKITNEKKDTIIFQLTTGNELIFLQKEILTAEKIIDNKLTEKCGYFEIFMKGYSSYNSGFIKIDGNVVSAKKGKYLPAYYSKDILDWVEFIEADCDEYSKNNYYLKTIKNEIYRGQLISINYKYLTFSKPGFGERKIELSEIGILKLIKERPKMFGHERSLFLGPTGFNLQKGDRVLESRAFVHNSLAFGLSDHFSISAGAYYGQPVAHFKTSFSFQKYLHWSFGGGFVYPTGREWGSAISIGTPEYFMNLGYSYIEGEIGYEAHRVEALHFGSSLRMGAKSKLFGEYISYYVVDQMGADQMRQKRNLASVGVSYLHRKWLLELSYSIDTWENEEQIGLGPNRYVEYVYTVQPRFAVSLRHKWKKKG